MSDTNVGTIKLGIDIEVGSLISKQIEGVSKKIASNLKSTIEKSTSNISKNIESSVNDASKGATKAAKKVGKDTGEALTKSIKGSFDVDKWYKNYMKDIEAESKEMAKRVSEVGDIQDKKSKASPFGKENIEAKPKVRKYTPVSSINDSIPDGALDLVVRKDNLKEVLQGRIKQLDDLSIKMGKLELAGKSDSSEFAKARVSYGQLSESIEKTSGDIRKLDDQIKNYDAYKLAKDNEQAAKETSNLEREAKKAASALNKQAIEAERLAQAKLRTANATNQEKLSAEKLKQVEAKRNNQGNVNRGPTDFGNELISNSKKVGKSSNMMRTFSRSMVRNLLGMNLALSVVSKGVRSLANGLISSFKSNDEFNRSLIQIKSNLSTAFQPIFQAVMPAVNALMNGLSKLTAYIAGFTSALFGKSIKASNASAKAMKKATDGTKKYSDSVKEAQQITAGFDQLNDITEAKESGSGANSTGEIIPVNLDEADMTFMEKSLSKVKGLIKKVFDSSPVKAFASAGIAALTQFQASSMRIWGAYSANLKQTFSEMWPHMSVGLSNVGEFWTSFFTDLTLVINEWVPKITDQVVILIDNIASTFRPFFVLISKMWKDWTQIILDLWNEYGKRILDGIGEFINGAFDTFNKIWTNIIDPIIKPAIQFMSDIWDKHLKGILFDIADFVSNAIARALDLYNKFIKPIIDWLVVNLGPSFVTVFNLIGGTVGGVLKGMLVTVKEIIGSIRRIFDGLMDFLEGVFSGDWKKVWQGMSDVFGGIFDGLKALFKAPINWIINGLNGFIRGINKVKIPDWVPGVGGKGFTIAPLTPLATGGVLRKPTPALMGEYPGARTNPEIVTPESLMRKIVNEAIAENGGGVQSGGDRQPIIINIGGMKFFETIIELGKQYATQTGEQVIFVG